MIRKKNLPNFLKNSPKSCQVKKMKKYIQQSSFWKTKTLHQTTFKTLKYIQQIMFSNCNKCNKFAQTKSSPKSCHYFGLLHLFKKSYWASKSSPIGKKIAQSGHPDAECRYAGGRYPECHGAQKFAKQTGWPDWAIFCQLGYFRGLIVIF